MEREEILKEGIKKLLSLQMSDDEIISNLKDSGVDSREAKKFLRIVKEESEKMPSEEENLMEDNILEEQGVKEGSTGRPSKADFLNEEAGPVSEDFSAKEKQMLDLWERGILATVDSKVAKMEKLKTEIETIVEAKIAKAVEKQEKKFSAVFESQRVLTAEKTNQALDKKQKEFTEIVGSKIKELKSLNALGQEYFTKLESQKKFNESLLAIVDEKAKELSKAKSQIISEFNSEIMKVRSQFEDFLKDSENKRTELNERINRSLRLETEIVEGLLNDAKNKIDNLAISKTAELEKMIESKISSKTKDIQSLLDETGKKMQKSFDASKVAVDKSVKEFLDLQKEIDVDKIHATMEELTAYRKQFVSTIDKSVESFEKAKKELADLITKRESMVEKKVALIDVKMKELDEFEKGFAEEMGVAVEKLVKKKAVEPGPKTTVPASKKPKKA